MSTLRKLTNPRSRRIALVSPTWSTSTTSTSALHYWAAGSSQWAWALKALVSQFSTCPSSFVSVSFSLFVDGYLPGYNVLEVDNTAPFYQSALSPDNHIVVFPTYKCWV